MAKLGDIRVRVKRRPRTPRDRFPWVVMTGRYRVLARAASHHMALGAARAYVWERYQRYLGLQRARSEG